jgi:hypothetical protein
VPKILVEFAATPQPYSYFPIHCFRGVVSGAISSLRERGDAAKRFVSALSAGSLVFDQAMLNTGPAVEEAENSCLRIQ